MTDTFISPNGKALRPADVEDEDLDDEDKDQHYTAISFDPGGTTGWCVAAVHNVAIEDEEYTIQDNIVFWSAGEFNGTEDGMAKQMVELAEAWPNAKIVAEDFVLRKFTSGRELLAPVRVFAKFEHGLWLRFPNRITILQPSSLAMSTVTDARLKKMGLYTPLVGKEHARDAARHNFTWMRRAKQMAIRKKVAETLMNGMG